MWHMFFIAFFSDLVTVEGNEKLKLIDGVKVMIYMIKGVVKSVDSSLVIIDVQGVGFGVSVAHPELCVMGQAIELHTSMHWNQETGPQLFGFNTILERQIFTLIVGCSGVGPKLALSVLQALSPALFITAISLADTKTLSSINGIGTKKAESIIMQLRDKVDKFALGANMVEQPGSAWLEQIKNINEVLQSLNYSRGEISQALEHIKKTGSPNQSFDELLRKALAFLAKQGKM